MKKKIIIGFLGFIILLITTALALPLIFKDDIKKIIDEQIKANVNADVYFDSESFSLSLFKSFPDLTVSLNNFGVVGREVFEKDTLLDIESFYVTIDLWKLIDGIEIKEIALDGANFKVKVLADGRANYDITFPDTTATTKPQTQESSPTETDDSDFKIAIKGWKISNTNLIYEDKNLKFFTQIENLNHSGNGDFSLKRSELTTRTLVDAIGLEFDGVKYLNKNTLKADLNMDLDLENSKYTFEENRVVLNDLVLTFDGFIALLKQGYQMDLSFKAPETEFKHVLSLIPAIFMEGFETLKTKGNFELAGQIKGTYDDVKETIPSVNLDLAVSNGFFQYPDLPTPVEHITLKTNLTLPEATIEKALAGMTLDISKFHIDFGRNPVHAKALIKGYPNTYIKADASANLDLTSLTEIFPIDSLELRGLLKVKALADGTYDSLKNTIPKLDISIAFDKGYIKYESYPVPIENIGALATVKNTNTKLNDTYIDLVNLNAIIDNESLNAEGHIYNLDDAKYEFNLDGKLDLALVPKIIDLEGTDLKGKIEAHINTKGQLSLIEKEAYDRLPTNGSLVVDNLSYKSPDFPAGLTIKRSELIFNPKAIKLTNYTGTIGRSDLDLKGALNNYIPYIFSDQTIKGQLTMRSKLLDLNEFMTEEEAEEAKKTEEKDAKSPPQKKPSEEESFDVSIPRNIEILFSSSIQSIKYDNFDLKDFKGSVQIKDGVAYLRKTNFKMLKGLFAMDGSYDTRQKKQSTFKFKTKIESLSIPSAYSNFNTVKSLAPIAQNMQGTMGLNFNISGALNAKLDPLYDKMDGGGIFNLANAAVQNSDVLKKLSQLTSIKELDNPKFNDVKAQFELSKGKLTVKPFDVAVGDIKGTVSGTSNITGELDYVVKTDVPVAYLVSNELAQQFTDLTGQTSLPIPIRIGGTMAKPSIKMGGGDSPESTVKEAIKQALKKEVDAKKEAAKKEAKNTANDLLKDAADGKIKNKEDLEKKAKEAAEQIFNIFSKKKKKKN